jgi:hypothetical protein
VVDDLRCERERALRTMGPDFRRATPCSTGPLNRRENTADCALGWRRAAARAGIAPQARSPAWLRAGRAGRAADRGVVGEQGVLSP